VRRPTTDPWVFSVEPQTAQITWRHGLNGVPGVQLFEGLDPDSTQSVRVDALDSDVDVTTIAPPPGPELCRIATINDLHIGCQDFGLFGGMKEPPAPVPHAVRCMKSAIDDALAWSAQLLIVKGDLTHYGRVEEWQTVGYLLAGIHVPVAVVPGNHDVKRSRHVEPQPALAVHGLHLVHGVEVIDLPGVRVVLADTTVPHKDRGRIAHLTEDITRVASRAAGGVFVALHHHPQRHRVTTFPPAGIPGPESAAFLRALAAANPASFVATGHSHRHRRHDRFGVTITEVGSTKDFPGTWTGYAVHEGGIRQVVRRISDPTCLPWLDHTRRAAAGMWGLWSPGRLEHRCFSVAWSTSRIRSPARRRWLREDP
jgi:predicted phosphodiesterase